MTTTVGQIIEGQASRFVGREAERSVLGELLMADGPTVVFVHGIAGVGKSALLRAFAAEARSHGAAVIALDCGAVEPTERGFLAAVASATGDPRASLPSVVRRLAGLAASVVLTLDAYELFRGLDPWLVRALVPALPGNVRLVLAGREAPFSGWTGAFGGSFRHLPLGSLSPRDAETVLRDAGVRPDDAGRINRVGRGHPLSLLLAAAALRDRPRVDVQAASVTAIVAELTRIHLTDLDPLTRRALDAASVVRRATRSLLAAMLPEMAPQDAVDRVRALAFVEVADDGLVLHETVREAVAGVRRAVDPDGSRRDRAAAWRCLRDEVKRASNHEMWRYTADLLFILENPIVREAFFPTTEHRYLVDTARPDDADQIRAIVARHEPPSSAAVIEAWWAGAPETFRVARDPGGTIAGFHVLVEADQVPHRLVAQDPLASRWWDHIRASALPRGQRALFSRVELALDHADSPSPVQAAMWLDIKRRYMELRPELRLIYSVIRDPEAQKPLAVLGFRPLPGAPVRFDGFDYHSIFIDFGPGSVDGWLSALVAAELRIDDGLLDASQRQLVLDGRRVDLTPLEFRVLEYLQLREGRVVDRASLLRDVWGYDDTGGSNVIETLMRSLRRKLGDRADAIETVRGLGYRFTMPP